MAHGIIPALRQSPLTSGSPGVVPTGNRIQQTPRRALVLRIRIVDVPDVVEGIKGPRTIPTFRSCITDFFHVAVELEVVDGPAEEPSGDEEQQARGEEEEDFDLAVAACAEDDEAAEETAEETHDGRQGDRGRLEAEGDTTEEHDGFETFTESSDERDGEEDRGSTVVLLEWPFESVYDAPAKRCFLRW